MKFILTILIFISLNSQAQSPDAGWQYVGLDTVPCLFRVSSLRFNSSNIFSKKGLKIRMVFHYTQDRIPCDDCDYEDRYLVVKYLDHKKKEFTSKFHVWEVFEMRKEKTASKDEEGLETALQL